MLGRARIPGHFNFIEGLWKGSLRCLHKRPCKNPRQYKLPTWPRSLGDDSAFSGKLKCFFFNPGLRHHICLYCSFVINALEGTGMLTFVSTIKSRKRLKKTLNVTVYNKFPIAFTSFYRSMCNGMKLGICLQQSHSTLSVTGLRSNGLTLHIVRGCCALTVKLKDVHI